MIYRTIAARDNVTIAADVDEHDYINQIADIANQQMEERKDQFAKYLSDMIIFGHAEMVI